MPTLNLGSSTIIEKQKAYRQIIMPALFVSDIHIIDSNDKCLQHLMDLVDNLKPKSLIFLGDIFDAWVGWDADPKLAHRWQAWIETVSQHCHIYFLPGNRDQLLQRHKDLFAMHLLPDPCIVKLGNAKWLLTHGDQYCVNDRLHLIWIRLQRLLALPFLHLPLNIRLTIRSLILGQSKRHKTYLPLEQQSIPEEQWNKLWAKHQIDLIVHGHTHRPAHHYGTCAQWVTLGDWGKNPSYLYVEKPQRWTLCFTEPHAF